LTYYKEALRKALHGSDSWQIKEKYMNGKQLKNVRYVSTGRDVQQTKVA
jgi:hypothetical protein